VGPRPIKLPIVVGVPFAVRLDVGAVAILAAGHESPGACPVEVHGPMLNPALAADFAHQNGISSLSKSSAGAGSVALAGRSRCGAPPRLPPEPAEPSRLPSSATSCATTSTDVPLPPSRVSYVRTRSSPVTPTAAPLSRFRLPSDSARLPNNCTRIQLVPLLSP